MDIIALEQRHIPQIAEAERLCFSTPWSERSINEMYNDPSSHFFCVSEDEKIIAYIGFSAVMDEANIYNIAVLPEYRRRGAAQMLLSELDRFCRKNGIVRIMLEVRESNEAAISLYEKSGYLKDGIRKAYYSAPKENAVLMTKHLDEIF